MRVTRPSLSVTMHRVVERIDRRLGRLLRDEQLAQVRSAQLADPLGHPVEAGGERADLVRRSRPGPAASRSPAASRVVAAVSWRDRSDDRVRQAELDARRPPPSATSASAERDEEPAPRDARRGVGLAPHRLLIQAQQPIAVGADRVELRLERLEIDGRRGRRRPRRNASKRR